MSKRVADYQLTSENCDELERSDNLSGKSTLLGKEDVNAENSCEGPTETKEEMASRRIVRIRKKCDDLSNDSPQIHLEGGRNNNEDKHDSEKEVTNIQSENDQKEDDGKEDKINEKENNNSSDINENNRDFGDKNGSDDEKGTKENDDSLPFGNTGLSSTFKNPFISLATNNENNFLFSGFENGENKNKSDNLFGFGGVVGSEENNLLNSDELDCNEQESNNEELTKKAFSGEENEETVYHCKNADLFILKELENNQKTFKKMGNGIIHLNIPKCTVDDKTDVDENSGDSLLTTINKPRIIFRQSGIYKVLLNTPLNKEISKTFQKNNNIKKGYAVNFVAFNEESETIQCMIRFQNEIELDEFIEKVNEITNN
ncbi:hypothetical protein FG379_001831 [Cryptosporidium bovis]|uniref:uncharacterized protein n=1 Tax=Cryptosporidium bovis TaxID=310047 RepID=UPI003519DB1D|nr:hypothetical protein FG379_001831 [Cryptosporidium bovis]